MCASTIMVIDSELISIWYFIEKITVGYQYVR